MTSLVQKPKPLVTPRIWKRDEIFTFLEIFESTFHASVTHPFESETDMWKCISDKLQEQGITASAQHCQNKWNFLYKTYVSNQNQQGAFYAKIRQIVELSKELSDQQVDSDPVSSEEQTVEDEIIEDLELDTYVKKEEFSINEGQCVVVSTEECFAEQEHLDVSATSNVSDDRTEEQCDIQNNSLEAELPVKRRKLTTDVDTSEQNNGITMDKNSDAKHIQLILRKIDEIHKEQISQGRRIDIMERRQSENSQILLDIKDHLGIK